MSNDLIHIAARIHQQPLLIHPTKAEVIVSVIAHRIGMGQMDLDLPEADANRFVGDVTRKTRPMGLSAEKDGVAIVPVHGTLVNRGAWLGPKSGMTSYEGLQAQIRDAVNDPEINSILLDIDSPGGEAAGMFDLASTIRSARAQKRVVAVVNDMAASAAYGIASAADEIVVSPTSTTGSIGVVMMHLDRSVEMQMKGIRPTFVYAGAHKIDGNPFGPLPADVRADLQASVDTYYSRFVEAVGEGRGQRLSAEQARATEARTYIGAEAVKLGLADRVASFHDVFAELTAANSGARRGNEQKGVTRMAHTESAPAAENAGMTIEAHETALASARAEAHAEGAAAERARITAILRSEAADGRSEQAMALALETNLSAADAEKVLAVAPKTTGIAARAAAAPEIGASAPASAPVKPQASWDSTIERVNKRLG